MVKAKVDMKRRNKLSKLHTATHLVNFAARKVLGNHVWQNGSNLKEDFGTLDITHYENLTSEEIFKIERLVNDAISECKNVHVEEMERTAAEKKYGFTLYQGGAIPMKTLRVVHVEENDIEACGGIHVENTSNIGFFKIVETSKIQDGVVRLKYVVGENAYDYVEEKQNTLIEISKIYEVQENQCVKAAQKFFNEWKTQKKDIENLKKNLLLALVNHYADSNKTEFKIDFEVDMGFLLELFTKVLKEKYKLKITSTKFIIATTDYEIDKFKKVIAKGKFNIYVM
jgi:alanyl-tRNA synthetase